MSSSLLMAATSKMAAILPNSMHTDRNIPMTCLADTLEGWFGTEVDFPDLIKPRRISLIGKTVIKGSINR